MRVLVAAASSKCTVKAVKVAAPFPSLPNREDLASGSWFLCWRFLGTRKSVERNQNSVTSPLLVLVLLPA